MARGCWLLLAELLAAMPDVGVDAYFQRQDDEKSFDKNISK